MKMFVFNSGSPVRIEPNRMLFFEGARPSVKATPSLAEIVAEGLRQVSSGQGNTEARGPCPPHTIR